MKIKMGKCAGNIKGRRRRAELRESELTPAQAAKVATLIQAARAEGAASVRPASTSAQFTMRNLVRPTVRSNEMIPSLYELRKEFPEAEAQRFWKRGYTLEAARYEYRQRSA